MINYGPRRAQNAKIRKIIFATGIISDVLVDGLLRHPRGVAYLNDYNRLYVQESTFGGIVGGIRRGVHSRWRQSPLTVGNILPEYPIDMVIRGNRLYSLHRKDYGSIHVIDI